MRLDEIYMEDINKMIEECKQDKLDYLFFDRGNLDELKRMEKRRKIILWENV